MSGFKAGLSNGATIVDVDIRAGTDGTAIAMHDTTIDRTTTGTGNANALNLAGVRALTSDPGTYLAPGWGTEPVPTLDDICKEMGNQVVLICEAKTGTVDEAAILSAFARWGIQPGKGVVSAFDYAWVQRARSMGYPIARWVTDINSTSIAANAANGVFALGASTNLTAEKVQEIKAAGMLAGVWTLNTRAEYDDYVRLRGCDFFVSDEPVYVSGRGLQRLGNQFAGGFWPHGLIPFRTDNGGRGRVTADGKWQQVILDTMAPRSCLMGFLGATSGSWQLDFILRIDTSAISNSSYTLHFNCPTDVKQGDYSSTFQPGYLMRIRRQQEYEIYRVDNLTTITSIGKRAAGTALPGTGTGAEANGDKTAAAGTGTPYTFRLQYNATTGVFTFYNLTTDGGAAAFSTTPDFTYQGGYIYFGRGGGVTSTIDAGIQLT